MTLTVDVPYLIAARLVPAPGCVLAHVANYGMMARHLGQPSQHDRVTVRMWRPQCDSRGRDSAGYRLQHGDYRRTVGQATQRTLVAAAICRIGPRSSSTAPVLARCFRASARSAGVAVTPGC